jgi:hypothetical protein
MKTISGTTTAWLAMHQGPEDLIGKKESQLVGDLFYSTSDMSHHGWSKVGPATITLEIPEDDQLINNKVDALRKEITKTRADAEMKARGLEEKVQQLLAITNEVKS